VHHGQDRQPQVHLPAVDLDLELAVLRAPLLRDVQAAHDLEAGDQGGVDRAVEGMGLPQQTIRAITHPALALERLDVDVRDLLDHRLVQDHVDGLDDLVVLVGVEVEVEVVLGLSQLDVPLVVLVEQALRRSRPSRASAVVGALDERPSELVVEPERRGGARIRSGR
jgi:hypothetical protein